MTQYLNDVIFSGTFALSSTGAVLLDVVSTDDTAVQVRFISNSPTNRRFLGQSSPGVTESQINFGTGEIHFWGAAIANKLLHISPTSVDADEDNVKTCGSSTNRWSAVWSVTPAAGDNSEKCATTQYVIGAVPNASYRNILDCSSSHTAARAAGTYWLGQGVAAGVTGVGTLYPPNVLYIDPGDYPTVNGLTTKLRLRIGLAVNDVAPTGNYTFGLYPVTRPGTSGAAGLCTYTMGTVVAGSTAAVNAPAADSNNNIVGADFAIPAAGFYVIGFVSTAAVAASSHLHICAVLQQRNT